MSAKWETDTEEEEKQKQSSVDDMNGKRSNEYFGIVFFEVMFICS